MGSRVAGELLFFGVPSGEAGGFPASITSSLFATSPTSFVNVALFFLGARFFALAAPEDGRFWELLHFFGVELFSAVVGTTVAGAPAPGPVT